jgi:hypothetical protein
MCAHPTATFGGDIAGTCCYGVARTYGDNIARTYGDNIARTYGNNVALDAWADWDACLGQPGRRGAPRSAGALAAGFCHSNRGAR